MHLLCANMTVDMLYISQRYDVLMVHGLAIDQTMYHNIFLFNFTVLSKTCRNSVFLVVSLLHATNPFFKLHI